MTGKFIILTMIFLSLLITGCGSSSSSDVIPAPTPQGDTEINGNITKISDGTYLSDSRFYVSANFSFLTDVKGDFTYFTDIESENYLAFYNTTGLRISFLADINDSGNNRNKIFINNTDFFICKDNMNPDEFNNIRLLLKYITEDNFSQCELEAESYISLESQFGDYKKNLYIIRDFAILNQDFSRIDELTTSLYFSQSVLPEYISPVNIYGGILYSIESILYKKDSFSINKSVDFLKKIRNDELSFVNNTSKIFGFTSDDLKSLLLLAYIYTDNSSEIEKFRSFSPQETGSFSYNIRNLLTDLGFLREN